MRWKFWLYFGSKNFNWHKYESDFRRIWIINPLRIREKQSVQAIRRGVRVMKKYTQIILYSR